MNTSVISQEEPDAPHHGLRAWNDVEEGLGVGECVQGKYIVHGVLGHGGFGIVYDVEHLGLGRRVALKVLHLRPDTPLALVERFRREARISALVHHPNVLEVYDTGTLSDGSPYLVMERVTGQNLSAYVARGPLSIAMAVEVARQVLQGLSALADMGVVHRDVKPDNLMLHEPADGPRLVKLVDFGISKRNAAIEPEPRLTCHGALVGTPQYMAPEQIRGEEVDCRADLYALGGVLYEMLTGHAPHESSNFSELVVAVLGSPIRPVRELRPNCPFELEQLVLRALSRVPSDRYSSAREMLQALDEIACIYELPRGADAFRARDRDDLIVRAMPRMTLAIARRWWPLRIGVSRPLQLTLLTLLLGSQGAVLHSAAVEEASEPKAVGLGTHAQGRAAGTLSSPDKPTRASSESASLGAWDMRPARTPPWSEHAVLMPASSERLASPEEEPQAADPSRAPAPVESAPRAVTEPARRPRRLLPAKPEGVQVDQATPASEPSDRGELRLVALEEGPPPTNGSALADTGSAAAQKPMQKALAALAQGRLGHAQRHYDEAVQSAPRLPAGWRGLGLVSARLGEHGKARQALRRYLELAPEAPDREAIVARLSALPR